MREIRLLRGVCGRRCSAGSLALAGALLALAAPAGARPTALIAGPVAAHPNGYRMLLIAGQGQLPVQQAGPLGGGRSSSRTGDSLSIMFIRKLSSQPATGTEFVVQSYIFPIDASVMGVLRSYHRLIVSLAGPRRSYGTIDMRLARGRLRGIFGFDDSPFRGPSSLPAELITGTVAQAYLRHTHLPKPTGPPSCPAFGSAALFGFTMDPAGNSYVVLAARPGTSAKVTIAAEEIPDQSLTAPAVELREVVLTGAPTTDLSVQPPSQTGSQQNTGGAILQTFGGLPGLQGGLSFDGEFPFPLPVCGGVTVEGGTILTGGPGPPPRSAVVGEFQATFDGPFSLGSTDVTFWNPWRGLLVYR